MSLRAFVALVAVALLGVTAMVGAITGTYVWMVPVIVVYVVWTFIRDGLDHQGRAPLWGYCRRRFMQLRDRPEWWS